MSGKRNVSVFRGHELANALYIGGVVEVTHCAGIKILSDWGMRLPSSSQIVT